MATRLHLLQPSQSCKITFTATITILQVDLQHTQYLIDTCTEDVYNYRTIPAAVEVTTELYQQL